MTENISSTDIWRRICGTFVLFALGASVVVAIGLPAAGVFTSGTFRANFAVALIVISVIIDVAVLAAYSASVRIQQIAHVAWLTVAIVGLAFSQYILKLDYSDSPRAADSLLGIVMYLLAFPAGNIAVGFLIVLDQLIPSHANSDWWDLVVYWVVFFAAGYLQWFKLLPWLIEKWRAHRLQKLDDNQKVV